MLTEEQRVARCYLYLYRSVPNENGCIIWQGSKTPKGYGDITIDKKWWQVHRYIAFHLLLHTAEERERYKDKHVCHRCDTPPCINPEHLFFCTNLENKRDSLSKGRTRGAVENNSGAILTWNEVREMRTMYNKGIRKAQLMRKYNMSFSQVDRIIKGVSWVE